MKRLTVLLAAVCLFLTACATGKGDLSISFYDQDFAGVDQIKLVNAHNGKISTLSDPQEIASVCDFLLSVSGKEGHSARGYYEGTYTLTLYQEEAEVFSIGFGDSNSFFYGEFGDGYPVRYLLDELTIASVTAFLGKFET